MQYINYIILDVDGTLTDGNIVYDNTERESKSFSIKDGLILKVLPQIGISVAFFTGRSSKIVEKRGKELGINDILQGISDKKNALFIYLDENNINIENTAYIGDDLNDYAAMSLCGFKACPANAAEEIKEICDYISLYNGGNGAVRDIVEHILKKQGQWNDVLKMFKNK